MNQRFLKSLLLPDAYPEPTKSVRLLQTHVSFLFITDNFVYKIKKPVNFGFLNFSTIDRRRFYCNEEVRLNRRLCPEIYLGVVDVLEVASGAAFRGDGKVIDYAVKMKKLPEERMLDRMLEKGKITASDIRKIARTIAKFHLNAERGRTIDRYGRCATIRRNWEENFRQIEDFVDISLADKELTMIKRWVESFLAQNQTLFAERVSHGFIRDCDGDIHLENICLTSRVCIFDCIEFNSRFRYTDTAADIAFFLMDLDFHDKKVFSDLFLDEYIKATGDRDVVRLLDFYKIYRAVVRGKVESLKMLDPDIPAADRDNAKEKARRYFRLARGYVIRQRLPKSLFITCGLMGSGKSATASALAFELGVEVTASDAVRKELAKSPPDKRGLDAYGEGIYTPAFNEVTYRELLSRTEKALKSGRSIIVDATFRRKEDRLRFAGLAARYAAFFCIVHTSCPDILARERLDSRSRKAGEISDGRWELFHRHKEEFETPGPGEGKLIFLDTSQSTPDNIDDILNAMEFANGT